MNIIAFAGDLSGLDNIAHQCHETASSKGFWPVEGRNKAEMMMLEVSEIVERLEAVRAENAKESKKCPGYTEEEEEWADLMIRTLDYAKGHCIRIEVLLVKMAYNEKRPYMHGKKF